MTTVTRHAQSLPVQKIRPAYQQVADQIRDLVPEASWPPGPAAPRARTGDHVRRQPQHDPGSVAGVDLAKPPRHRARHGRRHLFAASTPARSATTWRRASA